MNEFIENAQHLISKIVERRFMEASLYSAISEDENGPANRLLGFLLHLKFDMRLYAVSTVTHVEDLWEHIRSDEVLMDFIMGSHAEFRMNFETVTNDHNGSNWISLINYIANAYAQGNVSDKTVMDSDTAERLPVEKDLRELLVANPWMVTLYLMQPMHLPLEFNEVARKGKREIRSGGVQ